MGEVRDIRGIEPGLFEARIALTEETTGITPATREHLFGNASLLDDVVPHDAILPAATLAAFGGRDRASELKARVGAGRRPLTCSALKPQGLSSGGSQSRPAFAQGGDDYIKDDHGLADQAYSSFAERVTLSLPPCGQGATGRAMCQRRATSTRFAGKSASRGKRHR